MSIVTSSIVVYHTPYAELQTVVECAIKNNIDIIYVIDHSSDELLVKIKDEFPQVQYIHRENTGYGGGHNVAIRKAIDDGADYHVVLNPDIYFDKGVIEELVVHMDNNSDIGHIMPKVYYPNGELQYLCKLLPTPMDLIFKRFLPDIITAKRMHRFQLRFTSYDKEMDVPYLSGCFMFFRVDALKKVGLFDERFFMYPEDIDITRRIHERYRTVFYPAVKITHAHAALSKTNAKMMIIHILNMMRYFNKWGWIFDAKRRKINRKVLSNLGYYD